MADVNRDGLYAVALHGTAAALAMDLLGYLLGGAVTAVLVRWWQPRLRWAAAGAYLLAAGAWYGDALATPALQVPTDIAYANRPWQQTLPAPAEPRNPLLYDVVTQMLPFRTLVRERLLHGEAPLWTHEIGAGQPLLGNAQSAPFAPFHLMAIAWPPLRAMTLAAAWQTLLALLLMHALVRALGAGEAGAALSAIGYAFSTYLVAWAYYPIGMAACWIPGVLLGLVALRRGERGAMAGLVACAVGLALSGHPESLAHTAVAAAATAVGLLAGARREVSRGRFVARLAIAAGLAGAFAAPVLLPILQVLRESERFVSVAAEGKFAAPAWEPAALRVLVNPLAYGSPRDGNWTGPSNFNELCSSWVGLVTLAVALAGALAGLLAIATHGRTGRERRESLPEPDSRKADFGDLAREGAARGDGQTPSATLALWMVLAAALAGGAAFGVRPLIALFHAVPGLAMVPGARLRLLAVLAMSLAAGLSLESLAMRRSTRWVGASCIVTAALALLWMHPPRAYWQTAWWIAVLLGAGACATALVAAPLRRWSPWIAVTATAVDLALLGFRYNPLVPGSLDVAAPPVLRPLLAMPDRAGFRVTSMAGDLLPNLAALYGLNDPRFYDPMHPAAVRAVIGPALGSGDGHVAVLDAAKIAVGHRDRDAPARPMLDYLGVRYMLARSAGLLPRPWRRAWSDVGGRMWENPAAMPLFTMPARIERAASHEQAIAQAAANRDFRAVGFVESSRAAGVAEQRGEVSVRRVSANGFTLDVATRGGGIVVSSVTFASGWRIAVDGHGVEALRVNGAFVGFAAQPGRHRIALDYRPAGWTWGWRLAAAGALAAAALALVDRRRRRIAV